MFNYPLKTTLAETRKSLVLTALLLFSITSFSQISVGFGLRSNFGGLQALSDVKQFYNDNRTWLDKEFSEGVLMNGVEFGLEYNSEEFGMSLFHFYYTGSKTKAKGTYNGIDHKRILKARMWGVEMFDFRWTPIHLGTANIGFGLMPLGLGIFRVKTKLNDEETFKPAYSYLEYATNNSFGKAFHMFAQVHADLSVADLDKIGAVHFQFFYSFGPAQEYELYYLNRELNPTTYPSILKRTYLKMNNFGAKLILNIN